jgi:hypothetical protein
MRNFKITISWGKKCFGFEFEHTATVFVLGAAFLETMLVEERF